MAGQILCVLSEVYIFLGGLSLIPTERVNVLTILALLYTVNGLLTYIGRGFGIQHLTIEMIFGYVFYPLTFLMGRPQALFIMAMF